MTNSEKHQTDPVNIWIWQVMRLTQYVGVRERKYSIYYMEADKYMKINILWLYRLV